MRRLVGWFLGAALFAGCAASAPPPPASLDPVPIASAPADSPPVLRVEPRNLGHLPASPAAQGSVDPARLSELIASLARRYQPHEAALVEHALGLPSGCLASGNLAASMGVDPSRPVQLAVSTIDVAGQRVVDTARTLLPKGRQGYAVPGLSRAVQKAFSANRPAPIHLRIVVPASNPPQLLSALPTLVELRRYAPIPAPDGIEALHMRRERAVALSLGPQVVVVDILVFEGVVPSSRMAAETLSRTWRSLLSPTGQAPLATGGSALRWTYAPAAVAALGFLETLSREQDRISIERDQDPDTGMTASGVLASGMFGFSGAEPLRFRSVETTIALDDGRPRLTTSTELAGDLPARASGACPPSVSVDFPGALSRFDISTTCTRLFDVPGDTLHEGAIVRSDFARELQGADGLHGTHWLGWPLAVPWAPFALARFPLAWNAGVGPRAMQRMERFGWSNPAFGAPDVFWGLLPVGAKGEVAACAADEIATGCRGKRRLKTGVVHDLGGAFARLVPLGNRLVLLTSRDRRAVETMAPVLTAAPVPAMRAAISEGSTRRVMAGLGMEGESVRYVGELTLQGTRIEAAMQPAK